VDDKANFQVGYIRYNDSTIAPRTQVYGGFNYDFGGAPPYRVEGERRPEDGPLAPGPSGGAVTGGGATGGGATVATAKSDPAGRVVDAYNKTVVNLTPAEQRELANQILNGLATEK